MATFFIREALPPFLVFLPQAVQIISPKKL